MYMRQLIYSIYGKETLLHRIELAQNHQKGIVAIAMCVVPITTLLKYISEWKIT